MRDNAKISSPAPENMSPDEHMLWELLREPISRDDLVRMLKMPTSRASEVMSLMEIKGLIKDIAGKIMRA